MIGGCIGIALDTELNGLDDIVKVKECAQDADKQDGHKCEIHDGNVIGGITVWRWQLGIHIDEDHNMSNQESQDGGTQKRESPPIEFAESRRDMLKEGNFVNFQTLLL